MNNLSVKEQNMQLQKDHCDCLFEFFFWKRNKRFILKSFFNTNYWN